MYGINKHNGSLVIFDRFSLENANTVVFAKSGAGKSYVVKLEALRSIVFGTEVLIVDPEEEYRPICQALGGNYIDFSANSVSKINPFDLSGVAVEGENELGQKILSLHTLLKLMFGELTPTEEAILDRALIETYRLKGITPDPDTQSSKEPPVMEDLYKVLLGGSEVEARGMADRLEKFIKGSMTGIFDSQSNIDLDAKMTVFSTKNLEDTLRPIAFYMILDFVWTRIRKDLRKRLLIIEEAWYLMQNEDSARFLYGIAKRARKYYLGLTTITQDVDDFLKSDYGHAVVSNSSIQLLLKQHPAAIDKVAEIFYLSEGEKRLLLAADRGEGLFFAGANHVAIRVMASKDEHRLITTNPEELLAIKEQDDARKEGTLRKSLATVSPGGAPSYKPSPRVQDFSKYDEIEGLAEAQAKAAGEPMEPTVIGMENVAPRATQDATKNAGAPPSAQPIQPIPPQVLADPKPLTSNTPPVVPPQETKPPLTSNTPPPLTSNTPPAQQGGNQGLISLGDDGKTKVSQLN
jgi:type IV secretory pathway VirB4 component